jgi:hypothetical protein
MRLLLLAGVSAALLAGAEAMNGPPPPPPPPCDSVTCTHGSCSNINNNNGYTCCDDGHCGNGASCTAHTGACSNVCQNGGTHDPATGGCTCTGGWTGTTCTTDPCTGYNCGHGTCHGNKQCTCAAGYSGNTCQDSVCDGVSCNGHGSCQINGGGQASCSCSSGYGPGGTGKKCEPVPCSSGTAPSPPHTSGCSRTLTTGDSCTATCEPGWTGGTHSATFTCGADGSYSGRPLTCQKVPCNTPPPLAAHSKWSGGCSNTHYQDTCTATCDPGWTAGAKSAEVTCKADGSIDPLSLTCEEVNCGRLQGLPSDLHRTFDGNCASKSLPFKQHCKATCNKGYTAPDFTTTCDADGREASGKYQPPVEEASKCTSCPAGSYKDQTGGQECTPCPAGKSNGQQSRTDSSVCIACKAGQYAKDPGSSTCEECAADHYQPKKQQTKCIQCQDNSNTKDSTGQTKNDDCICIKGWWAETGDQTCRACQSGKYKDQQGERGTHCVDCGRGKYSTAEHAISESTCRNCTAGKYSNQPGADNVKHKCENCAKGKYLPSTGAPSPESCIACQDNSNTKENTGQTKNDDCICIKGWYAGTGDQTCRACQSGKYKDQQGERGTQCVDCDRGKYSTAEHAISESTCSDCGTGKYLPETGASDSDSCIPCEANSDTSWPEINAKGQDHCVCKAGFGNRSWAPGLACQGSTHTTSLPRC